MLAATLACMMTLSMATVAQAKGDKKSDKEITIGVTSFADTLERQSSILAGLYPVMRSASASQNSMRTVRSFHVLRKSGKTVTMEKHGPSRSVRA
mgnify:CR=1 FL=1